MSISLYQLDSQYKSFLAIARDTEINEEVLADTLEGLRGDIAIKCDSYVSVMRQLEGEIKMFEEEISWIQKGIETRSNAISKMKSLVTEVMKTMDTDEIKGDRHTIKLVNNGGLMPLKIDGDVPDSFMKIKYDIDTKKIRDAIENNEVINFAHLEPRGKHITIK